MTDPIRRELADDLHAVSFGESIACDYHTRPKEINIEEPVLAEAITLVDHPQLQLDEWPEGWILDAARCSDHSVEEIAEPTKGFHEVLITVPVTESHNIVSVDASTADEIHVVAVSSATEGCHPMLLDQRLMDAAEPGDMGLSGGTVSKR